MDTIKRIIKVNGIDVDVEVEIIALEDEYNIEDVEPEHLEALEDGKLFMGVIFVHAKAHGLEGMDVLGSVLLVPNNMFNSEPFNKSVMDVVNDNNMIATALKELAVALEGEYESLKARAESIAADAEDYKQFAKQGE